LTELFINVFNGLSSKCRAGQDQQRVHSATWAHIILAKRTCYRLEASLLFNPREKRDQIKQEIDAALKRAAERRRSGLSGAVYMMNTDGPKTAAAMKQNNLPTVEKLIQAMKDGTTPVDADVLLEIKTQREQEAREKHEGALLEAAEQKFGAKPEYAKTLGNWARGCWHRSRRICCKPHGQWCSGYHNEQEPLTARELRPEVARTRLQRQTPRPDVASRNVGWERYPTHRFEVSCTWLFSQSSFATGIGAICIFAHQFASLPCRCSSR